MADTPPSITPSGAIVYPPDYAPSPATGPLVNVIFAPGSIPVTPEVIGADLANVDIAFLRSLQNPLPNPNPTAAEDAKTSADLSNYVINNADASQLTSIGFTIGHILGGTNAVGDYLGKLVTDELMIGDGRGFVGVNENLNAYISVFFGPQASEPGGVVQFLQAVAGGWPPELAYPATLASSPIQLRTT
jgi:hypothetical protein